jgi:hypothetical protein
MLIPLAAAGVAFYFLSRKRKEDETRARAVATIEEEAELQQIVATRKTDKVLHGSQELTMATYTMPDGRTVTIDETDLAELEGRVSTRFDALEEANARLREELAMQREIQRQIEENTRKTPTGMQQLFGPIVERGRAQGAPPAEPREVGTPIEVVGFKHALDEKGNRIRAMPKPVGTPSEVFGFKPAVDAEGNRIIWQPGMPRTIEKERL